MRCAPWMLSASLIAACGVEALSPSPNVPSAGTSQRPPIPTTANAFLWVVVADSSGSCIPGASLRVVSGQLAGETRVQDQTPCSVWDYGMGTYFNKLWPDEEMTIAASAEGYVEQSETFYPNAFSKGAFFFFLVPK